MVQVKCRSPGCGAKIAVENYSSHMAVCEFRDEACPHESCEHRCIRRELEDHIRQCPHRSVTCDKGCSLELTVVQLVNHSCLDELKRKLEEVTSDRDTWKRKAEDAGHTLGTLKDTLHRIGVTAEGLSSNIGDLGSRLRSAEALAATGHLRPARRQSPRGAGGDSQLGVLFGSRTARLLEEIASDSDHSWSPQSNASQDSFPDDEDLYLDLN